MKESPVIAGFGFTGYRSVWSDQPQVIGPMDSVHLIVGANNVGKSNILRFAAWHLPSLRKRKQGLALAGNDRPKAPAYNGSLEVTLGIRTDDQALMQLLPDPELQRMEGLVSLRHLLKQPSFLRNESALSWINYVQRGESFQYDLPQVQAAMESYVLDYEKDQNQPNAFYDEVRLMSLGDLLTSLRLYPRGDAEDWSNIHKIFQNLELNKHVPEVELIESSRRVTEGDGEATSHSGVGLVKGLAALQNPTDHDAKMLGKFSAINEFVKTVTEDPAAQIRIPYTQDKILFESRGRVLPLENLGDGIHQVVILAAAATLLEDKLVCIEEPEVHLHPILQRRLLAYLASDATSNRYLIATHSAHILDHNTASISHVTMGESGTAIQPAVTLKDLSLVSAELGYRASDIIQANCVIWVEGPSDRIYLSHWISCIDNTLMEGIHYVVMFYGGSVLDHLSTEDPDEDAAEFISLRRLNRNMVVVMDSDKDRAEQPVGEAKVKVATAMAGDTHGRAWITEGYTIENYVPRELLSTAITAAHRNAVCTWQGGLYVNPLRDDQHEGTPKRLRKTLVAVEVVKAWPRDSSTLWRHDLRERIEELVKFIRKANDLAA